MLFTGGIRLHHGGGVGRVTILALAALLLALLLLVRCTPPRADYEPLTSQERLVIILCQSSGKVRPQMLSLRNEH